MCFDVVGDNSPKWVNVNCIEIRQKIKYLILSIYEVDNKKS